MKEIKNFNKFKLTYILYTYFYKQDNPYMVIKFIYQHVYELLNEIKCIPHSHQFEDFFHAYRAIYYDYYEKQIASSNDNWLKFLFPNPSTIYYFSFTKFYIGLWGRVQFGSIADYTYCDPTNWTLGYDFKLNYENKLVIHTCQYILLDNYSNFQVYEEFGKEQIANWGYVMYKSANKYPGQRYDEYTTEDKCIQAEQYYVNATEESIWMRIIEGKTEFNTMYDQRIGEVCKKISNINDSYPRYEYVINKPLHTYKGLEEELKPILEKKNKEREIARIIRKYKTKKRYKEKVGSDWEVN